MKTICTFLVALLFIYSPAKSQKYQLLKEVQQIKMPKKAGEEFAGANGAAIAWHPVQKKYYAAMAGNKNFPLAIFDKAGTRLSSDRTTTLIDLRGLWYNPKNKKLSGNGYNDYGWFTYTLDSKGDVKDIIFDIEDMAQPSDNSVGCFNSKDNQVMFLDESFVSLYSPEGVAGSRIKLQLGIVGGKNAEVAEESDNSLPEAYNFTTIIYTGNKKAEIGLLNTVKKQVELYDKSTGYLTNILQLPEFVSVYKTFNFSFANDMYWFFDKDTRVWTGFK